MTTPELEALARARVKEMKHFYKNLTLYCAVSVGTILIWALSDGGYFWPVWVILGWGIGIFMEAVSLKLLPKIEAILPFLNRNWEEKMYQKILTQENKPHIESEGEMTLAEPTLSDPSSAVALNSAETVVLSGLEPLTSPLPSRKPMMRKPKGVPTKI